MKTVLFAALLLALSSFAFAKEAPQINGEGLFELNQNPREPGQAPIYDERLAPSKDADGIILPQENKDLPLKAAILFGDKKKKSFLSKGFIFGFITGGALIAFVSFFMLKYTKRS